MTHIRTLKRMYLCNMSNFFQKYFFYIFIVFSMFVWGISWPSAKIVSVYGKPVEILCIRFFVVWLVLGLILILRKVYFKILFAQAWKNILITGLLMTSYSYCFLNGVSHGFAGAGGVLVTTLNPIFAFALGLLLEKKVPKLTQLIGLSIGLVAGLVLLKIWAISSFLLDTGNLFFLAAALIWAIMSKITAKASQYGDSAIFSFYLYVVTWLVLVSFSDFSEITHILKVSDGKFWINIFFNGAISTSICTTFYFYATTKVGAENASSFIFLVPISAAISSFVILGENILLNTLIGGVLGVVAVYLINRKSNAKA